MSMFYMVHGKLDDVSFIHETTPATSTLETVIRGLMQGQYAGEIERVSLVDIEGGTVTDASREIAWAIQERSSAENYEPAALTREWVESFGFQSYAEPVEHDYWLLGRSTNMRAA
jgi:hypothetical protein